MVFHGLEEVIDELFRGRGLRSTSGPLKRKDGTHIVLSFMVVLERLALAALAKFGELFMGLECVAKLEWILSRFGTRCPLNVVELLEEIRYRCLGMLSAVPSLWACGRWMNSLSMETPTARRAGMRPSRHQGMAWGRPLG